MTNQEDQNMQDQTQVQAQEEKLSSSGLKLKGVYAFKIGMMTVYDENGSVIPVTALKYDPMFVSQVKTKEKDGYEAVQVSFKPKPAKSSSKAEIAKMKRAGFENSAYFSREIRQNLPEGVQVGQKVSIHSLEKGNCVKATGLSKGRGFTGAMKRHNFNGGPGAHGSKLHRQPGSVGMRTWPGRVLKGKRLPGQFGNERTTVHSIQIIDVLENDNIVLVKGPVPGAMNTLIRLMKE